MNAVLVPFIGFDLIVSRCLTPWDFRPYYACLPYFIPKIHSLVNGGDVEMLQFQSSPPMPLSFYHDSLCEFPRIDGTYLANAAGGCKILFRRGLTVETRHPQRLIHAIGETVLNAAGQSEQHSQQHTDSDHFISCAE